MVRRRTRREVVALTRELRARGLVTATVGNISVRDGDGLLITPSRREPDLLRARDLVRLGADGRPRGRARWSPSQEWRLHAAIYRARPDVLAVVHTHSPVATARSFDPAPLLVRTEERTYLGLERVEVAPWRPAGGEELAASTVAALGDRGAALLARHGVVAVGSTPREALELAATVEHQAIIDRDVRVDVPGADPLRVRRLHGA